MVVWLAAIAGKPAPTEIACWLQGMGWAVGRLREQAQLLQKARAERASLLLFTTQQDER
jgi:hypothetical protein